ncbi:unnamed protein product [Cylicocyclus nassatus]|uniref:Uncharacterized protein n=1 Tax=Cylicocyclus nassatus TaxID=53992 RepID=A0AA36HGS6_CYLNA|nr:unnamed protein product [Cylicocyclus nassatus]
MKMKTPKMDDSLTIEDQELSGKANAMERSSAPSLIFSHEAIDKKLGSMWCSSTKFGRVLLKPPLGLNTTTVC